jgi:hypothetical protein
VPFGLNPAQFFPRMFPWYITFVLHQPQNGLKNKKIKKIKKIVNKKE